MPTPLEEKIDQILAYQKKAHHWAVFRGIVSLIFFLLFVVLPLIASIYLVDYLKNEMDWSKFQQMQQQFQNAASLSDQFKEMEGKSMEELRSMMMEGMKR